MSGIKTPPDRDYRVLMGGQLINQCHSFVYFVAFCSMIVSYACQHPKRLAVPNLVDLFRCIHVTLDTCINWVAMHFFGMR